MIAPSISVLLYVPLSSRETVRLTIDSLRAQTARETLELILLAPEAETLPVDTGPTGAFFSVRVIAIGTVQSRAQAMAQGVREASAPLVAFAGNHSYPDAHWAARLIEAHQGPWAAVGPSEVNGNPATTVS